jgi:adenylate kinase family enzyme
MPFLSLPLPASFSPRRVVVVGPTGSGKTTLAADMAHILGVPHVEQDALFWEPGWKEAPLEVFRQRLAQALSRSATAGWVVDGNYSRQSRDLTWGQAEALVWLDYGLVTTWWRLLRRTLSRTASGEVLWGTNRETWRGAFFSRDSLFINAITSRRKQHATYPAALALPEYAHLCAVRLRSPAEGKRFLAELVETQNLASLRVQT